MTVAGYLGFVAEIKQVPGAKRKAALAKAIESASLDDVRGRLIKNISRGYKQRVGIAQAIIHDPKVLVLDEPTIGLDPAQIREIRELIKNLRGEHTVLLSTHILPEVTQVCDGVVVLNEGRVMASGSLEELTAFLEQRHAKGGIVIRLRKGGEAAAGLLRRIPGVDAVVADGGEIRLEWARERDLRDEVVRLVAGQGLGLLEMRPLAMNIEDLYMQIVSGGSEQ
jgi:ABC-2 type transport system ATP-binding protein